MAKRIASVIKLNIAAGKGTPAPPVGPALGQAGINMMEFLKKFNEMTAPQMGFTLPVEIVVYEDRSYSFVVKQPLTTDLIKRAREAGCDHVVARSAFAQMLPDIVSGVQYRGLAGALVFGILDMNNGISAYAPVAG